MIHYKMSHCNNNVLHCTHIVSEQGERQARPYPTTMPLIPVIQGRGGPGARPASHAKFDIRLAPLCSLTMPATPCYPVQVTLQYPLDKGDDDEPATQRYTCTRSLAPAPRCLCLAD